MDGRALGLSMEQLGTLFANIEDIYEFSRSGTGGGHKGTGAVAGEGLCPHSGPVKAGV